MMKARFVNNICPNCIYDGEVCGIKVCAKCAPNWDVFEGVFVCEDYEKKKEVLLDEKKKL